MNHLKLLAPYSEIASKPIIFQLICLWFVLLMLWDLTFGVVLFPKLTHQLQLNAATKMQQPAEKNDIIQSTTINHPIFGDYVPNNLDAAGIRQSMSNYIVVGVIFSTHEADSQVLLQKPNGQEHFFRVGERIPDGGVIKRITTEGVLILRDGKLERLSLPKEQLEFQAPLKPLTLNNDE